LRFEKTAGLFVGLEQIGDPLAQDVIVPARLPEKRRPFGGVSQLDRFIEEAAE